MDNGMAKGLYRRGRVVLTADDSVISNYNNNIYLGFLSCLPSNICPLPMYRFIVPRPENNPDGTVKEPPLPLRAVESICVNSGIPVEEIRIAQNSNLERFVGPETKIVGVSTHDPMGFGPATSTWSTIFGGEPCTRIFFSKLMEKVRALRERYDFKIVVGGSGAWQLASDDRLDMLGIDHLVVGEGEISIPKLFHPLLNDGSNLKRIVTDRIPNEDEIPAILGPTNCSLVEISRGCGRGCKFCATTSSGRLRSLPMEKIVHDVKLHADMGYEKATFQSDDCLRYGSKNFMAERDSLLNLYDECFATGIKELYITHANLVTFAHQPEVIEDLTKKLHSRGMKYYGCQPGLETGSYRLVEKHMRGKVYPRDPKEWGKTVIEALSVMRKNKWYPVCTLISGLPEEDLDDIKMTIDLIKKLDSFPALYIPLFFVPMSMSVLRDREAFMASKMTRAHWDLMFTCWDHNLKYIRKMYLLVSRKDHNPFMRSLVYFLTNMLKVGMNLKRHGLLEGG